MAYAALLSLTRTLDNIFLCRDEAQVLVEELRIKSLHQKLGLFISFLEDTSQKNDDSIEDLEERIRDVVYEAEDIIESHMSKQILSKSRSFFWDCVTSLLSMCQNSKEKNEEDLEKNEKDLQNVMGKLDSVWEEVEKMKDNNNIEHLQIKDSLTGPVKLESTSEIEEVVKMHLRTSSLSKSASTNTSVTMPMVGFEAHMLQVKELLAGSSTKLEAISTVGMGGIGKTTLARSIYDDSFVNRHFDILAWITISQKYDVTSLLVDLLKSMGKATVEINGNDMEKLKQKLYKSLKQIRYLIIMDDVWDTNFLKEFKHIFPDDNNGSRIILTSRSSEVANIKHYSSHIHRIDFLNSEQSWNLLRQKALGEEPCPPRLEEIGRKIVEKCKGLPLALAVIGGVLHKGKKTQAQWMYIEENMKSAKHGNYDDLMEVLSSSYNYLPHHLKACFLYMEIYLEDQVIHVSHLIWLWLAEGFIKPIPPKNLEQVAKEYLEDLIARNPIMVRDWSYYGEVKTCTIHDLIRELCTRKAREKMFLYVVDNGDEEVIQIPRFLSIHNRFDFGHRYDSTLRSLLYSRHAYGLPRNFRLQLLRVLDACNITFDKFLPQIPKLVNLRYLAFFYMGEKEGNIPASISKLFNLQTLIVLRYDWRSEGRILYLPPEILKMPWLRHLLVHGSSLLSYPCGAANGNLQLLSGLINFRFTKEVIEEILDLKILEIVYRYNKGTEWSFYCFENLVHMHQLEKLKLCFVRKERELGWCQLPLDLSFAQKLNKLSLSGCRISQEDTSVIGLLPNLEVLKLRNVYFKDYVWETNEGEFINLKFLYIESPNLMSWKAEETHFPSLECLSIRHCGNLECIPFQIGEIPTLRGIVGT